MKFIFFFFIFFLIFLSFFYIYFFTLNCINRKFFLQNRVILFIIIIFFIFIMPFILYKKLNNFSFEYYNNNISNVRENNIKSRILLNEFDKYFFKLKYKISFNLNYNDYWFIIGKLYETQNDYEKAMNAFYIAYKLNPEDNESLCRYFINKIIFNKFDIENNYLLYLTSNFENSKFTKLVLINILN